nr:acyltransferase [uncultured Rhodopila sp.]
MLSARIESIGSSKLQLELPALTGVRGLAAWWVVIYHFRENLHLANWPLTAAIIDQGNLAVDLFFVLSGFIIGMNYIGSLQPFSIRPYFRFLILRLGRIYPLHLFMMVVFLVNPLTIIVFSHAQAPGVRYDAAYFGMSLLLVQNWGFTESLAWNVPAWSISTEWFAYLIFPAIVWIGHLATNKRRAVFGIALCLTLLAVAVVVMQDDIPVNGLARCVLEFTSGTLVYVLWRQPSAHAARFAELATILWLPLFAGVFFLPMSGYPIAAMAWCVLIFGLANNRPLLSRCFSTSLIYRIGEYSYSTYLAHYFVRDWIKFLLIGRHLDWRIETAAYLAATAAASFVLYNLIEVPGRNYVRRRVNQSRLTPRPSLPGGTRS